MGEYHFGVGSGRLPDAVVEQAERLADRHGAWFVYVNLPGEGWRYWFTGHNRGEPFNGCLRSAVLDDLCKAGIGPWASVGLVKQVDSSRGMARPR